MSKLIIMVAAFAPQAGKTTFLELFCRFNPSAISHQFAAPIKSMLSELLCQHCGYTTLESFEALYGGTKEGFLQGASVTHRKMLQTLGTEWRLALGYETMWSDIVKTKILRNNINASLFIIDDWRYFAEYEAIKQLEQEDFKVITVCIRNTAAEAKYRGNHSSEGELKDFDFDCTLNNSGSLTEFTEEVKVFTAMLNQKS